MGNNVIIGIVIAIIIVAIVVFLVSYLMKKKNQDRLDALEKRKEELFDLPVIEEVDDVKKMHLVGQSQNTFREWSQKWNDISTSSFAELESQIFEVENLNESFRFLKGKKAVVEAEATMDQMEKQVTEIREGLKELRETEERNSLAVQQALDVFFIKPSLMPHQNIPRMASHTRSTSSMLIFVSLGRHTPRAKRSSPTGASLTLTKGQFAKTGCKCMGFQR